MIDLGSNIDDDGDAGALVTEEAPKAKRASRAAAPKAAEGMPVLTRIILEESELIPPTGLYIGHNGRGYLLKAGEEARVPAPILEILNHAVMSSPVMDPSTQQVTGYRDRMRYPYRKL